MGCSRRRLRPTLAAVDVGLRPLVSAAWTAVKWYGLVYRRTCLCDHVLHVLQWACDTRIFLTEHSTWHSSRWKIQPGVNCEGSFAPQSNVEKDPFTILKFVFIPALGVLYTFSEFSHVSITQNLFWVIIKEQDNSRADWSSPPVAC